MAKDRKKLDPYKLTPKQMYKLSKSDKSEARRILKDDANTCHGKAIQGLKTHLEYAHLCGEALIVMKPLFKHGDWQNWIEGDGFKGTYETAKKYMFLANHWFDPEIVENRKNINSVKGFLEVYYGRGVITQKDFEKKPVQPKSKVLERFEKEVIQDFTHEVKKLNRAKMFILAEQFYHFWFQVHRQLRQLEKKQKSA